MKRVKKEKDEVRKAHASALKSARKKAQAAMDLHQRAREAVRALGTLDLRDEAQMAVVDQLIMAEARVKRAANKLARV